MVRLVRRPDAHADHDGTTLIRGHVADQAALHGLIQKVRDIGLPLVSVTHSHPDKEPRP